MDAIGTSRESQGMQQIEPSSHNSQASSANSRKVTPVRPVYDDFQTAHLYITSGSAKSRQDLAQHVSFDSERNSPLPPIPALLKSHSTSSPQIPRDDSELLTVRVSPTPGFAHDPASSTPLIKQARREDSPRYGGWKTVLDRLSSSARKRRRRFSRSPSRLLQAGARNHGSEDQKLRDSPDGSTELLLTPSNVSSGRHSNNDIVQSNDGSPLIADLDWKRASPTEDSDCIRVAVGSNHHKDDHTTNSSHSGHLPKPNSFQDNITQSSQEESTVSNIVKHYENDVEAFETHVENDEEKSESDQRQSNNTLLVTSENWSSKSDLDNMEDIGFSERIPRQRSLPSIGQYRVLRMEDLPGRPPSSALPQIPTINDHRTLTGTYDGVAQSSSYGDTRNLLNLTQPTRTFTSNGAGGPAQADHQLQRVPNTLNLVRNDSVSGSISQPSEHRPERFSLHSARKQATALQQFVGDLEENHEDIHRSTLERDISFALRHEGSDSGFSEDSPSINKGNARFQDSSGSGTILRLLEDRNSNSSERRTRQEFYDKSTIPEGWLGRQKGRIRIPIKDSETDSLHTPSPLSTISDPFEIALMRKQNDETNEWETVGESGHGSQAATNIFDTMDVNVGDSDGSLASHSDDNVRLHERGEHNPPHLRGHMLKHPANSQYSHAYHRREIRHFAIPVLLPAHKDFSVNGFPTNTSRSPIAASQLPYDILHSHAPSPLSINHKNPFTSSPPGVARASDKFSEDSQEPCASLQGDVPPRFGTMISSSEHSDPVQSLHSEVVNEHAMNNKDIPLNTHVHRAEGADHIPPLGYRVYETRTAGSSIADESTFSLEIDSVSNGNPRKDLPGTPNSIRARHYGATHLPASHNNRLFQKRPPGAFYQGLRGAPNRSRLDQSESMSASSTPRRTSTLYNHATNKLRPLSLLGARYRAEKESSRSEDFVYRSPLAPIRSKNWCTLYTREQLNSIYEASKVDANSEVLYSPPSLSYGGTIRPEGSWRRLGGVPRMFPWPREDSSIKTDTASRKSRLSTFGLLLCLVFPPALPLYGYSLLDGILLWMTDGEISHFGRKQKKIARYMTWVFVVAIAAAVIIGIYYSRHYS